MHGLDWYDYGARYYEPVLSRFTTMDPLAEKYYSISPYAYCAGNPVMYTDPTGMWIEYRDDSGSYRYEKDKWMKYNTEGKYAVEYTPFTPESGSFMEGVLQALNTLNQNYTGNQILNFFANDENTATIRKSGPNENFENAADVENSATGAIYLSEKLEGSDIPTEYGIQKSPFWLDLGHELAHRQDVLVNGSKQASKVWLKPGDGDPFTNSEKYATHMENQIRSDHHLMPLRTHYGSTSDGGYEPSRILHPNSRRSIFYNFQYRKTPRMVIP